MLYMHLKTPEARHLFPVRKYHHGAAFKERDVLMRYCGFCEKKITDEAWQKHLQETKHYSV